jgi:hypothetical protein
MSRLQHHPMSWGFYLAIRQKNDLATLQAMGERNQQFLP